MPIAMASKSSPRAFLKAALAAAADFLALAVAVLIEALGGHRGLTAEEKEVARTQEVSDGVNLDFDGEGRLIGPEVLGASKRYSSADIFNLSNENLILNNT